MTQNNENHLIPILQAILVTLLWSSSFVIIKIGLDEIPPLLFAGLRYTLAFIFLLPLFIRRSNFVLIKEINKTEWIKLIMLGLIFYTFTQGAQFLGLSLLPSVTVSLLLNFTPIVVAVMGIIFLSEIPITRQWIGSALFITGVLVYFYPIDLASNTLLGIFVMLFGVLANSGAAVLGRDINRSKKFSPVFITTISMGIGAAFLLVPSLLVDGLPQISLMNWLLLLWMAVVNTAFAFTLWNKTLQHLTAIESSIINGTMLIQIAILAWIFLGESISLKEGIAMLIAAGGAVLVQIKNNK
ncbi:MAG: DMT family transporter [Melioribacteraceae bacterium]|nr:DMT family transporter [Melioribacteraceae bacterium]MCF8356240.1 DMT family transporter [Melioribacteraceae bacterium]MCF8394989.1 DMT family transporter [Melioribacteraceae bacterium]MCF8419709.1 DMT family transporter [Melioribacteraceae bacterium]